MQTEVQLLRTMKKIPLRLLFVACKLNCRCTKLDKPRQIFPLSLLFRLWWNWRQYSRAWVAERPVGATDLHVRYTPSTDTWDTLSSVPYRAQQPAGAVVNEKSILRGWISDIWPTSHSHFFYDADSNAWYPAAVTLPVAVAIHKCVELDGKLYVLSGQPDKTLCE